MLYRLSKEDNTIELMPYADFESLAKKEKDLENLLAENLGDFYSCTFPVNFPNDAYFSRKS